MTTQNTSTGTAAAQPTATATTESGTHALPALPYAYNALEPHIDEQTMRLHHDKHHQAYIDNLNKAVQDQPQLRRLSIEDLLRRLDDAPESVRTTIRNNGGGHANHTMFWRVMRPASGSNNAPAGALLEAVTRDFGSLDNFKTQFNDAGTKQFGSGWVFVIQDAASGKLQVIARPNQDSPLIEGRTPLFGNDVWEHAYYLKYQNKRADYLQAWWNVVDWNAVAARYEAVRAGRTPA